MQSLIKNGVAIILKSINFEDVNPSETKKIDFIDEFKIVSIESDLAEFSITRTIAVDLQYAYNLKVVAGIQVFAKEGINLKDNLTKKMVEENKNNISSMAMSFMSSLVAQITGSFNGIPIITAPSLKLN